METITLTFNPNTPIGANINAFVADLPKAVKVSKTVKPARKCRSKKELFLASLTKAARQAEDIASKPHKSYTPDELMTAIFDD